jgi:protein-L-isoaspartate O-methyltransferase
VIHSDAVEDAFRQTDRRFFVPPGQTDAAHADRPLKDGDIHISAPHIYGTVLEALELTSGSSFLNVGSGTGYLTCMVSHIMGPTSVSINIECLSEALEHSQAAVQAWKADRTLPVPEMQFYLGNVLQLDTTTGECLQGFDRIYVGAALEKSNLEPLANLLKVGGILVGPGESLIIMTIMTVFYLLYQLL